VRDATDVLVAPEPAIAILEQMKQSLCLGALCKEPLRPGNIRLAVNYPGQPNAGWAAATAAALQCIIPSGA